MRGKRGGCAEWNTGNRSAVTFQPLTTASATLPNRKAHMVRTCTGQLPRQDEPRCSFLSLSPSWQSRRVPGWETSRRRALAHELPDDDARTPPTAGGRSDGDGLSQHHHAEGIRADCYGVLRVLHQQVRARDRAGCVVVSSTRSTGASFVLSRTQHPVPARHLPARDLHKRVQVRPVDARHDRRGPQELLEPGAHPDLRCDRTISSPVRPSPLGRGVRGRRLTCWTRDGLQTGCCAARSRSSWWSSTESRARRLSNAGSSTSRPTRPSRRPQGA